MDSARYHDLLAQARRLVGEPSEAEDLLQDALLIAVEAGRSDPAWIAGVLRRQAIMRARGAGRRRKREAVVAAVDEVSGDVAPPIDPQPLLRRLPPAARRVAVLALHGLSAEEVRWILGISPAAFRQRLTSIRRAIGTLPPTLRGEALALAYLRDPARAGDLQFGLLRRALKAALLGGEALGTHDADGHLLVLNRRAHTFVLGGN